MKVEREQNKIMHKILTKAWWSKVPARSFSDEIMREYHAWNVTVQILSTRASVGILGDGYHGKMPLPSVQPYS